MANTINVNFISDTICPWCYIGYKRFWKAVDEFKALPEGQNASFAFKYSPFLLDPSLGNAPVSRTERMKMKFGDRAAKIDTYLADVGKAEGITFKFDGNVRQTYDSHRLQALAYEKGGEKMQRALVERCFAGYFENEKDPGDHDWLATEGAAVGLGSKEELLDFLKGNGMLTHVRDEMEWANSKNIGGVPFFIIQEKYGISGAQDAEKFVAFFKQLAAGESVIQSKERPEAPTC